MIAAPPPPPPPAPAPPTGAYGVVVRNVLPSFGVSEASAKRMISSFRSDLESSYAGKVVNLGIAVALYFSGYPGQHPIASLCVPQEATDTAASQTTDHSAAPPHPALINFLAPLFISFVPVLCLFRPV